MLRALYTSASGMQGQQMNLDVIANNLANVNTTGFKKSKMEFQDMLYQTNRAAGAEAGGGNQVPTSMQVGHGARAVATAKVFTNGELHQTGDKLDIAIHGNGFASRTIQGNQYFSIPQFLFLEAKQQFGARPFPADQIPCLHSSKGSQRGTQPDRFQDIRLALSVCTQKENPWPSKLQSSQLDVAIID